MTGILESWSLQLHKDTKMSPQLKSFSYCHIYSLWYTYEIDQIDSSQTVVV